jgi:hypothetical protein
MKIKQALKKSALVVALGFAVSGCSTLELRQTDQANLTDAQGHVIGHKEILLDQRSGEQVARISLYVPLTNSRGQLVGYEEASKGGSIIRDISGRRIGTRWHDVRSGKGITMVFLPRAPERIAVAYPSIEQLAPLVN